MTDALISALSDPACYPHAVDRVELRETHISWVLLAGEHAYKIKKPVKLGFLDFTTLARRQHYCHEEVRLNRRFAPELYLDVVSIGGTVERPRIGSGEPALEYAVRLRRFRAEDELAALLERNAVGAEVLAEFGRALAVIHAGSPHSTRTSYVDDTRRTVLPSVSLLESVPGVSLPDLRQVRSWLEQEWTRRETELARRQSAGFVRECHGDLHVGNIVRGSRGLFAFDCIEFDESLRSIDVANDVAFLFMDLLAHGRSDLAHSFYGAWLEESGDYDSVQLLRLFAVYRALVRAKVAALRRDATDAARYARLAAELLAPRAPRLIITCGLSGSGKTWLSTRLIASCAGVRVRSDVERKRMAGLRAEQSSRDVPGGIYGLAMTERVYARMYDCAQLALTAGVSIVVDAAFLKRSERLQFLDLAKRLQVPATILHCTAPDAELRARIARRQQEGHDASEADTAVLDRQRTYWEPFGEAETPYVIEVDTSAANLVETALQRLRA